MQDVEKKVGEAVEFVKSKAPFLPDRAIILGTGLGSVASDLKNAFSIPYEEISHFPRSTVESHEGKLIFGLWNDVPVVAMKGRFHLYEGYSPHEIAFPVRVLRLIGVNILLISNAAGGLNPLFEPADLMLIVDHINFTGRNPLMGPNVDRWGPRFPDMTEPYSRRLQKIALDIARERRITLHRGVYAGVLGPSMETAAETRMLRAFGADAVGMSTVMEVITAVHMGMEVLALSVITNVNRPDCYEPAPLEQVIATAEKAAPRLMELFSELVKKA
ncbi:purine-nucleoside phosphorylase [Thermodesulforhabdus norvegica]|uniref:Purine nucleoside phosphorylase n=1 Tax=Thermodesulforhabdus norvegica TaxID=39841 RepID=A0A1I4V9I3_9BACT|nr:purine-nucleoside phosphorylase [Thermodesulforhabdus norvegica]SFM97660.1 purine-nucleoside phosphorylase [Thermodesulforhabdus norvegica]